ncbi:EDD domain protein, DegV family [Alteribacillus persepolensis]|uniref:EDD domain protein, DegV family n=1 Tax=Alteribacillus persepolensis TaxID=568899 RepID=A0A1G8AEJ1_9BACI|nr:DegV family protein [Alteribacillus persepolensis]SDH19287.1 EDD domain protein, DegV family [Alteribacillus persepolensis]
MANIAIVTDSTAYLPEEMVKKENVTVVPLSVIFGDTAYEEETELSADAFYEMLQKQEELPTTSQPPLGKFVDVYESLANDYEAVISIHLSSGISGTYQTALTAGEAVDGIEVYGFDSEISCMPQGYYVMEASRMAEEGADIDDILQRLNDMKKTTDAYFIVDSLHHLHRGGRLTGAEALVGSLLQIKPVLHFEDKQIVPFEKVRTEKKALKRVLDLFDQAASIHGSLRATVIHANRPEKAETVKQKMQEKHPNLTIDVSCFGGVIGTHLGEGSIGIGWCSF